MAQTFNEIQKQILDAKQMAAELNALEILTVSEQTLTSADSNSKVAIWRLWAWVFAFVLWLHGKLAEENALNAKPQNLPNLKDTILNFHDGLDLKFINGSWDYDLTGIEDPDSYKLITNCAILSPDGGGLVVKVTNNGIPLTVEQLNRFKIYFFKKYIPGIPVEYINKEADLLQATITCYVNPEIIDLTTGKLLNTLGDIYPAKESIQNYLKKLEFNGAFVIRFFENEIMSNEGIDLVEINNIEWKYDSFPFTDFSVSKTPQSGHFKLNEENLTINYQPYVLVNG